MLVRGRNDRANEIAASGLRERLADHNLIDADLLKPLVADRLAARSRAKRELPRERRIRHCNGNTDQRQQAGGAEREQAGHRDGTGIEAADGLERGPEFVTGYVP